MVIYRIFTIICLGILILIFIINLMRFIIKFEGGRVKSKNREERINFVRKFKKGSCVIIYFVAIPLYFMGIMYEGKLDFPNALFSAISKSVNLIVLKYDLSDCSKLMADLKIYEVTFYLNYVLIVINALVFTLSLVQRRLWVWFRNLCWRLSSKEKLFVIGDNQENILIYNSEKNRNKILLGMMDRKTREDLFVQKILSKQTEQGLKYIESCINTKKLDKLKKIFVIINTKNESENIAICSRLSETIHHYLQKFESVNYNQRIEQIKKENTLKLFSKINIYVFGDQLQRTVYNHIIDQANGCIRLVDKYKLIAMDFVDKHPLTEYLTEKQLDTTTSLIKKNIDINVLLVGFGKTNQQVFFTSVANNQFVTGTLNNVKLKPVKYFIFDKVNSSYDKNLNHDYYRYRNEFYQEEKLVTAENNLKKSKKASALNLDVEESKNNYKLRVNKDDYLPLPVFPAEEILKQMNINDPQFYDSILSILRKSNDNVNYVIIAYGTDLENIDMAGKLIEKKQDWDIQNLHIFVKIRDKSKVSCLLENADFIPFANEKDVVYNVNQIVNSQIEQAAMKRNRLYSLEYEYTTRYKKNTEVKLTPAEIERIEKNADYSWYIEKSQLERESNIYACLSLRFKLQLMGLDYRPISKKETIQKNQADENPEEKYLDEYAKDDPLNYYDINAKKRIVMYNLKFPNSRRRVLAIAEHYRWNSYMLSKGIVPATKDMILHEKVAKQNSKELKFSNGKNYHLRHHGNLTTFDGLVQFRKMLAQRDKEEEIEKDVIKYDYQLMDDAYWILKEMEQEIYKR